MSFPPSGTVLRGIGGVSRFWLENLLNFSADGKKASEKERKGGRGGGGGGGGGLPRPQLVRFCVSSGEGGREESRRFPHASSWCLSSAAERRKSRPSFSDARIQVLRGYLICTRANFPFPFAVASNNSLQTISRSPLASGWNNRNLE